MKLFKIALAMLFLGSSVFAIQNIDPSNFDPSSAAERNSDYNIQGSVEDAATTSLALPNALVQNDFNMFFNPAELMDYGTAYGEIFNANVWGGSSLNIGKRFKIALFLGKPYSGSAGNFGTAPAAANGTVIDYTPGASTAGTVFIAGGGIAGLFGTGQDTTLHSIFDVFFALKVIKNLNLGVSYSFAYNSDKVTGTSSGNTPVDGSPETSLKQYDHIITLGVLLKDLGILDLGISANLSLPGFSFKFDQTSIATPQTNAYEGKGDGAISFGALVRPIIKINDKSKVIIPVSYTYTKNDSLFSETINATTTIIGTKDSMNVISVGAAYHFKPTENLTVIFAGGYNLTTRTIENVDSTTNGGAVSNTIFEDKNTIHKIPLSIAVEHQTFNWMKIRFGVTKLVLHQDKTELTETIPGATVVVHNSEHSKARGSDLVVSSGIGFNIKKFEIDFAIATKAFSWDSIIGGASLKFHF